jgi:hypothetical protein
MFAPHDTTESLLSEYRSAYEWALKSAADGIWWSMLHYNGRPDMNMFNRYER